MGIAPTQRELELGRQWDEMYRRKELQLLELRDVCVSVSEQIARYAGTHAPASNELRAWARKLKAAAYDLPEDQV